MVDRFIKCYENTYDIKQMSASLSLSLYIYMCVCVCVCVCVYVEIKCQLDATEVFIADLIACSTCFGHHYAHHQELNIIIQWLLPVVFRAVVLKLLVWFGLVCTGHITLSSTPDQLLEKPQHKIPHAATTV